jgi:hypothetical protein
VIEGMIIAMSVIAIWAIFRSKRWFPTADQFLIKTFYQIITEIMQTPVDDAATDEFNQQISSLLRFKTMLKHALQTA